MGSVLGAIPDEWGEKFEFPGRAVTYSCTGPSSIHFKTNAHYFLVMLAAQPERTIAINHEYQNIGVAPIGTLEIFPEKSEVFSQWIGPKQSLLIAIDDQRLREIAGMEFDRTDFEFFSLPPGFVDSKALGQAYQMKNEILGKSFGFLDCLDSMITIFSIHMLRTHSSLRSIRKKKPVGGLSPRVKQNVVNYIQDNLSEKITIELLAKSAHLSPSHFSRAFKETFGQSPYEFIMASRLHYARNQIIQTDLPFKQIAKNSGFSNNSHMTSVMQKMWSLGPRQIRHERS